MKTEFEATTSLFDWFDSRVRDAQGATGTTLSRDSELYLTQLLVDRARADRPTDPETALALLHLEASNGSPSHQARTYREIGDRSLYVLGYFAESLSRRTVGAGYYADMGAAAYSRADQVFKRFFANAFDDLFVELASHFHECVGVLRRVRGLVDGDGDQDSVLRLYQRWLETGSPHAEQRLRAAGLLLGPRTTDS